MKGRYHLAKATPEGIHQAINFFQHGISALGYVYGVAGKKDDALGCLKELEALPKHFEF